MGENEFNSNFRVDSCSGLEIKFRVWFLWFRDWDSWDIRTENLYHDDDDFNFELGKIQNFSFLSIVVVVVVVILSPWLSSSWKSKFQLSGNFFFLQNFFSHDNQPKFFNYNTRKKNLVTTLSSNHDNRKWSE